MLPTLTEQKVTHTMVKSGRHTTSKGLDIFILGGDQEQYIFKVIRTLGQGGQGEALLTQFLPGATVTMEDDGNIALEDGLNALENNQLTYVIKVYFPSHNCSSNAQQEWEFTRRYCGKKQLLPKKADTVANSNAFAVQFREADTLTNVLNEQRTPTQTLPLLVELLAILPQLESANIVHRDLKPDNILIGKGPTRTATAIDFGAAANTGTVGQAGTPGYFTPEDINHPALPHPSPSTSAGNVFAIGILMLETLIGPSFQDRYQTASRPIGGGMITWPFTAEIAHQVALQWLDETPRPPWQHLLIRIIISMTQVIPTARLSSKVAHLLVMALQWQLAHSQFIVATSLTFAQTRALLKQLAPWLNTLHALSQPQTALPADINPSTTPKSKLFGRLTQCKMLTHHQRGLTEAEAVQHIAGPMGLKAMQFSQLLFAILNCCSDRATQAERHFLTTVLRHTSERATQIVFSSANLTAFDYASGCESDEEGEYYPGAQPRTQLIINSKSGAETRSCQKELMRTR